MLTITAYPVDESDDPVEAQVVADHGSKTGFWQPGKAKDASATMLQGGSKVFEGTTPPYVVDPFEAARVAADRRIAARHVEDESRGGDVAEGTKKKSNMTKPKKQPESSR